MSSISVCSRYRDHLSPPSFFSVKDPSQVRVSGICRLVARVDFIAHRVTLYTHRFRDHRRDSWGGNLPSSRESSWLLRAPRYRAIHDSHETLSAGLTSAGLVRLRSLPIHPRSPATTLIRHLNRDTNARYVETTGREFINVKPGAFPPDYDREPVSRHDLRDLGDSPETSGHTYRRPRLPKSHSGSSRFCRSSCS